VYLNTQSNYDEILIEEFIKGATEFVGEGGCYHHEKTDYLLINLKEIVDEIVDNSINMVEEIIHNPNAEIRNVIEDSAGSMAITGGMMLMLGAGPVGIGVGSVLIIGGSIACFHAAGATSIDNLTNPKIFGEGAISIITSILGGGELKAAKNILKISKTTTYTQLAETTVIATVQQTEYNRIWKEDVRTREGNDKILGVYSLIGLISMYVVLFIK